MSDVIHKPLVMTLFQLEEFVTSYNSILRVQFEENINLKTFIIRLEVWKIAFSSYILMKKVNLYFMRAPNIAYGRLPRKFAWKPKMVNITHCYNFFLGRLHQITLITALQASQEIIPQSMYMYINVVKPTQRCLIFNLKPM